MTGVIGIWAVGAIVVYKLVPKIIRMADDASKPKETEKNKRAIVWEVGTPQGVPCDGYKYNARRKGD